MGDEKLKGKLCYKGERGYSAYEIAVQQGFQGTEKEWLSSLALSELPITATEINSESGDDTFPTTKTIYNAFLNMIYPVGSIYLSTNNVSPTTFLGGTWERIRDRFLLSAGDTYASGSTGGEASTTLTTSHIPKHTHGSKSLTGNAILGASIVKNTAAGALIDKTSGIFRSNGYTSTICYVDSKATTGSAVTSLTVDATHEHTSVGGGQAHNNMPPYLTVYMWKRTA